jgi:hypothetical protein
LFKHIWTANGLLLNTSYVDKEEESILINPDNNIKDKIFNHFQLSYTTLDGGDIETSEAYNFIPILYHIQKYFGFTFDYYPYRIKSNLQFQTPNKDPDFFDIPHIDLMEAASPQNNYWTILYYVNDSDGDTLIFNEKFIGTPIKNFSLNQRVSPKKGRILMFPSNTMHSGNFPINSSYRLVINLNVWITPHIFKENSYVKKFSENS